MDKPRDKLDIRSLQTIRSVLSDYHFDDTKWFDLGLELKLPSNELKVIRTSSSVYNDSDKLRECLSKWLESSSGPVNPRKLVNALRNMKQTYVAEGVCKILVDPASQLLLSFSDELSDLELTDELLTLLYTEELITRKTRDKIKESGYLLVDESLRAVCATVAKDHNKLKVLADILSQCEQTTSLAHNLMSDYEEKLTQKMDVFGEQDLSQQATAAVMKFDDEVHSGIIETTKDLPSVSSAVKESKVEKMALTQDIKFLGDKIRSYQDELAQPGLQGKNYIICAPTGSGKTFIAALIIYHHLHKKRQEKMKGKVLFIVSTQQLAHQQNMRLREYISGIDVIDITGDSYCQIHLTLSQVDIIVCTAGKLLGELNDNLIHISDITLLVLDECHHTSGRSPYADVMEHYLLEKRDGHRTPHVIGMTASPGAGRGRFPGLEKAIDHQLRLCARVDATSGMKAVQENIAELRSFVPSPSYNRHALPRRNSKDSFVTVLSKEMKNLKELLPVQPRVVPDPCSLAYQQWVKNEIEAAQLSGMSEQRDQITILELLEIYHLALITYEDFEIENAKEILDKVKSFDDSNDTERQLQQNHKLVKGIVNGIPGSKNPLLLQAKELLLSHFTAKPESKALFFVRAMDHTQYVSEWIMKNPGLSRLIRPCSITGHSRKGSMSKADQIKIIESFRSGEYNLLVTTSVLEEGLDVPQCNMVIRFQIMSNEVSDVQAQGRARADDSTLHTIVTSDSPVHHRLLINNDKKEQANQAVQIISQNGVDIDLITKLQEEILDLREQRIKEEKERGQTWKAKNVDLHCYKCDVFACNASELCKFGKNGATIVPSQSFIVNKMKKISRKGPEPPKLGGDYSRPLKIACVKCNEEWGVWGNWEKSCVQYPVLQCKKFTFCNNKTGDRRRSKQWKYVPFEVVFYSEFEEKDID
ncbi:PREDICTED: probable ATP-dependent RNA helicase DHX58 isoform X2 [Amphimedon queenslandica]|uniref:RNA helicase n=1 Tax=Amphimedon queenslandica TaxID=400682 RepID=A0AAN0JTM5_AMPQE|nr:PREDICTED: probable ATP-dependent RNA helicase DHX58 isoform X2 [Amphimedon queenslandica]|eukprot:XP_019860253.1 PREDICTED: probable ATP-dependent RNA helicase DHX58 isoform X2 [Amphimedon queenslandica]